MDRLATPADAAALVAVINAAFVVEAGFIRGPRTTAGEVAALLAGSGVFLVVDHAEPGRLAAAVHVEAREGTAHFGMLAVDPALQGRGLARRLLAAVEAHAHAAGCTVVELDVFDVRTELPLFYASLGYRPVGTRAFRAPELLTAPAHLIVMQKALGAEAPG
ncbi:MAG: GNAT family N-acetyltransferase [Gemmatimonadetes bacterium]|nr:GNAT family N-acetyltransferase [Gemmatimonadota bacterium]